MRIGDVEIHRGDLADAGVNCVLCDAAAHADRVLELAAERERAEVGYGSGPRAGETTLEIYQLP